MKSAFQKVLAIASAFLFLPETARSEDTSLVIPFQSLHTNRDTAIYYGQKIPPMQSEADRFLSILTEIRSPTTPDIGRTLLWEDIKYSVVSAPRGVSNVFGQDPSSFFSVSNFDSSIQPQNGIVSLNLNAANGFSVSNTQLENLYLDGVWADTFSESAELQRVFQEHHLSRLHLDLQARAQSERDAFETALQNNYGGDAANFMLLNQDLIEASVKSSQIDKAIRAINSFPHVESDSFLIDARTQLASTVTAFQDFRKRSVRVDGQLVYLNDERLFSTAYSLFRMRFPDKSAQDYSNFLATGYFTPPDGYGDLTYEFPFDYKVCDTCMVMGQNGVTSFRVVGEDGISLVDFQGGYVLKGCNRSASQFELFFNEACPEYLWDATDYPSTYLLPAIVSPQMEIDLTNLVPAVVLLLPDNRVLGLAEGKEPYKLFKGGTPLQDANSSTIYDTRHCTAFPNQSGTHVYTAAHCLTAIWGSPDNDEIFELDLGAATNCEHITTAVFLARVWEKSSEGKFSDQDVFYCKTVTKLGGDFVIVELDRPMPLELLSGLEKVIFPEEAAEIFNTPSDGQAFRRRAFSIGFPRNYTLHTSVGGYFAPDSNCLATYEMFYASPYFMRSQEAEADEADFGLNCTSLDTFMGMSGAPVFALYEDGAIELVGAVSWAISSRWSEEELSRNENSDDGLGSTLDIFNVYAGLVPL